MKSLKRIKSLDEIVSPLEVCFPVTIEGSVNNVSFKFIRGESYMIDYPTYEAIKHSSYGKYLG